MTKKKDHDEDEAMKPRLGTGAFGDLEHPAAGAPVAHDVFEPAPVDAPESVEKEELK